MVGAHFPMKSDEKLHRKLGSYIDQLTSCLLSVKRSRCILLFTGGNAGSGYLTGSIVCFSSPDKGKQ